MLKQEIENEIKLLRVASLGLNLLPNVNQFDFPVKMSTITLVNHTTINVIIPYSIEALRLYRKGMGQGWKMEHWTTTQHDHSVSKHADFIRPNLSPNKKHYLNPFRVMLTMDTSMDKSVCHIEQDGIEEKPVWKVVCQ